MLGAPRTAGALRFLGLLRLMGPLILSGALQIKGPHIPGGPSDNWGPLRWLGALVHCTTCTTHCYATVAMGPIKDHGRGSWILVKWPSYNRFLNRTPKFPKRQAGRIF